MKPEEDHDAGGSLSDQKDPEANENSTDATDSEADESTSSVEADDSILRDYLFKDRFLQKVGQDEDIAAIVLQSIVRRLTGNNELKIRRARIQPVKLTEGGRIVILDLFGEDVEGNLYNIEFQRKRSGATYMRAEIHVGLLRSELMKQGMDFGDGPTAEVYFITEKPYFSKSAYPDLKGPVIQIYNVPADASPSGEFPDLVTGKPLPSKEIIRYVDGSYEGDDELGELVSDLWCTNTEDIHDPDLKAALCVYLDPENKEAQQEMAGILETGTNEIHAWYTREVKQMAEEMRQMGNAMQQMRNEAQQRDQDARQMKKELKQKDDQIALLQQQLLTSQLK